MNSIFFQVLRRMRVPMIVLIAIYAISVLGLTLVPGVDANGKPAPPLSFFHAFYFISYTATTIGFGEIPGAFSDAQRLWVIVCIYLTVIGWSYSILTLLALFQDKGFQNTLVAGRFARRVRHMREPFYLVCGAGETGSLVCETLDRLARKFVIIEKDELRVQELELVDFKTDTPALAADARLPDNLLLAGLRHDKCRGVLALTDDEQANLGVAIASRLINPNVPMLACARTPLLAANLASFGTDHIINPFERFAEYLGLAVAAPQRYRLIEILTGLPGSEMPEPHRPPRGRWIVCGYGRFGRAIVQHLAPTGIDLTIIDPEAVADGLRAVRGLGTDAATLIDAGVREAQGIVAGSDSDVNNLSIAVTAKELNLNLFVVTRQNHTANSVLFDAFRDDFCMVPSRIIAQECIAILTTPLLTRFLDLVRDRDEAWCQALDHRLEEIGAGRVPEIWGLRLNASDAPAVHRALMDGADITLEELLRDNVDRECALEVMPLLLDHEDKLIVAPDGLTRLAPGDQLLLAGRTGSQRQLDLTLQNANVLDFVISGRERGGSWLWHKLTGTPASSTVRVI
jgi:Trk K+ transport system NAD-binding subunit